MEIIPLILITLIIISAGVIVFLLIKLKVEAPERRKQNEALDKALREIKRDIEKNS